MPYFSEAQISRIAEARIKKNAAYSKALGFL